ncbi:MAG: toll/interleukin-1 receptor domain-containing protein [Acidobacteriota bacterium]|nr:toll/interleukin-1 receptor domain-containing protein [Acidobacteriota bacterium]
MSRLSVVLCYAHDDECAARDLAAFLECNLDCEVSLGEGVIDAAQDLIAAAERGLSADAALVLLSPASVPKVWKRERWEPVFFGDPSEEGPWLGFALLGECRFPELLRRRVFFDFSRDARQGAREVRHWLMRREGVAAKTSEYADLRAAVADQPGTAHGIPSDVARAFALAYGADFEAVHRVACHGRTAAGILGDLGYSMGVPMTGNAVQNRAALENACRSHRWLLILEDLPPEQGDLAAPGGRASVIAAVSETVAPAASLEKIGAVFMAFPRDNDLCAPLIGLAAIRTIELLRSDFEAGLRLGWVLLAVLKDLRRFAEMVEILAAMEEAARARGDEMAIFKIEWEQSWISEESETWGVRILPTAGEDVAQLSLFDMAG